MAVLLRGREFVVTEALTAATIQGLMHLASRRPLLLNGVELCAQDLAALAEEAERTGMPVWLNIAELRGNVQP